MISRRSFLFGACCAVHAWPAAAAPLPTSFICATPDDDELSPGAAIDAPAVAQTPSAPGAAARFPLPHRVGATLDPQSLWTERDGATPDSGVITLNICLLNGTGAERRLVRRVAPEWTEGTLGNRIKLRFIADRKGSHVRIRFRGGKGNLSQVGRRGLKVPSNRETMNLDDVNRRGVLHEFGHVLGLRHEHQNPASGIVWNKPVVIAALAKRGWSRAKVEDNIFKRFSKDCACPGDPSADSHSIMMYPFPKDWTLNGFSTHLNQNISPRDRRCLVREYRA
jgi:serralysin